MRVVWSEGALADRDAIVDYFGQYNFLAAVRAGDRIQESVDLLQDFPQMGSPGKVKGTREFAIPRNQCVVVYRFAEEQIAILRVIHGGQEWPTQFND